MKTTQFLSTCGKAATYTSDGQYMFPEEILAVMDEIRIYQDNFGHSAIIVRDNIEYHLIYAGNGSYFTTSGRDACIHLIARDIEKRQCWLAMAMTASSETELKPHIRRFAKFAKTQTSEQADLQRVKKTEEYPWQCGTLNNSGRGVTFQQLKQTV